VLTDEQRRRFSRDGYVVVPAIMPEELLVAADAEIDGLMAELPPPAGTTGTHFYFKRPARVPAADALFRRSPIPALAHELVAPHTVGYAFEYIQIVLNIPPHEREPVAPHLDGHRPHQTKPDTFSVLAAVFLGDETAPDRGNIWVWPGSHLRHERLFAERGPEVLLPVSGNALALQPPLALGRPTPVLARRGDVLLAHFLLGHSSGPHTGDAARRIVYHRLVCTGHESRWADTLADAFTEYAPLRHLRPTP
jgi:ectoine hydroxylase-related dioxygenase (phytanoyl-CoA dioxygenase family)